MKILVFIEFLSQVNPLLNGDFGGAIVCDKVAKQCEIETY